MAEARRDWTAEIDGNGHGTLWAGVAYNPKFGTFAIDVAEHARRFKTKTDVEAWIARLKVENAKPVKMKG